jgi:hypothetical protein
VAFPVLEKKLCDNKGIEAAIRWATKEWLLPARSGKVVFRFS